MTKCRHGNMMYSDNDAYVGKSLDLYKEYSEVETRLLQKALKPGQVVVEVGANIGALTIPMAKSVGNNGIVLAFEPQKTAFYALCGNVFINNLKNVFCHQRALGDCCGKVYVPEIDYDIPGNYGAFSIIEENNFNKIPNKTPVELNTLDEFNLLECDLIKIDVEGMELNVLRGAADTIKTYRPLLCVENDRNDNKEKILEWLHRHGYECWQHFPPFFNENNFNNNKDNIFGPCISANLICFPKDGKISRGDFQDFDLVESHVKITINR